LHTFTSAGFTVIDVPCVFIRARLASLSGTGTFDVLSFSVS
jgi:hypothetical protein